jgi:general secretion pathway protein K
MLRSQKGFALIVTLLITAVIVGLVTELVYAVYISVSRANNFRDSQRASLLARSGVDIAKAGLEEFLKFKPFITMDSDGLNFKQSEDNGELDIKVFDEQGKASLKIVYPNTGAKNEKAYNIYLRLLKLLNQSEDIADTLSDWIDSDDEPRMMGAEGLDYYQRLLNPYPPKNGYLDTLEEILMIKGYTPQIYSAISPFVTVYNTSGLININTANKEIIMSLSDEMTETLAQRVIDYRKAVPFKARSDIMKVAGFETIGFSLQDKITVESNIFKVYSSAKIGEAVRAVEAVIQRGGGILYWREG